MTARQQTDDSSIAHLYQEVPLSSQGRSIRILDVLPGSEESEPAVNLRTLSFDSQLEPPRYEALSYTWGTSSEGKQIIVNKKYQLPITNNLYRALRNLRKRYTVRRLWVDAICIDQSSLEERSNQVAIMGEIYQKAACVNIWLGDSGARPTLAWRILRKPSLLFTPAFSGMYPSRNSVNYTAAHVRALAALVYDWPVVIDETIRKSSPRWPDRAWVVQEFALGQKRYFWCGRSRLRYEQLAWEVMKIKIRVARRTQQFSELKDFQSLDDLMREIRGWGAGDARSFSRSNMFRTPRRLKVAAMTTASDGHDKVYSHLSLMNPEEAKVTGSDYKISIAAAYAKCTFATLQVQKDVGLLHFVTLSDCRTAGLPSWAIDFAHLPYEPEDLWNKMATDSKLGVTITHHHAALDNSNTTLTLTGIAFDVITKAKRIQYFTTDNSSSESSNSSSLEDSDLLDKLAEDLLELVKTCLYSKSAHFGAKTAARSRLLASHITLLADQPRPEVLALMDDDEQASDSQSLTLSVFLTWDRLTEFTTRFKGDTVLTSRASQSRRISEAWRYARYVYASDLGDFNNEVAFFTTSAGFIGLAPISISEGDLLVRGHGSQSFLVLHPQTDRYGFRGMAYIHGTCSDEIWNCCAHDRIQEEEFALV